MQNVILLLGCRPPSRAVQTKTTDPVSFCSGDGITEYARTAFEQRSVSDLDSYYTNVLGKMLSETPIQIKTILRDKQTLSALNDI